jgi:uncharacterized protein (DUF1800 family)
LNIANWQLPIWKLETGNDENGEWYRLTGARTVSVRSAFGSRQGDLIFKVFRLALRCEPGRLALQRFKRYHHRKRLSLDFLHLWMEGIRPVKNFSPMNICQPDCSRLRFVSLRVGLWFLMALLWTWPARAQMIDLNHNGMSDIWEQLYGATGLDPNADADGDGVSNLREALAGTNPFDSNSYPHITMFALTATNFSVTIPCQLGKVYQLQSVTALGSTNWQMETGLVVRSGSSLTLAAANDPAGKFFRIAIADTNTDGSAMNDWEKYLLGLDPFNPFSNGTLDGNGQLLSDYAFATNMLAAQNVVTISASDPSTMQPDPGQSPTDLGAFTVTRGGFPLSAATVNLALGGPGSGFAVAGQDYIALQSPIIFPPGSSSQNISVVPLANTNLPAPVVVQLQVTPGAGYTVGAASNADVVIYPSATASGSGLTGYYFTNSSTTYTNAANFNKTNLFLTRVDPVIDFTFGGTNPPPNLSNGLYSVRWTGQLLPQYSETYYFDVKSDDGVKLWVNDQLLLTNWQSQNSEWTNSIALQGGTRYDLKLEYLQNGGSAQAHLNWYSASQSKQIIPSNRLYPTNNFNGSSNAPAIITSALSAVAFLNQPFSYTVTAANTPLKFTASGLPPGLLFNSTNGLISGTPTLAGNYPVTLTASNAVGVGASLVNIQVIDTGSAVVREVWLGVPGTNVADIPTSTPATFTNTLTSLEGITNFGSNYGERVRGYFTAPVTGNYYFWIAASDAAELWISDDGESVNQIKRANVWPSGTAYHQWNAQTNQQSKWLTLVAGQKYFVEILHKAGTTAPDHWSVGWLQDPTGTNTAPSGVVPGYVLSRYYPTPISVAPGTLYTANMLALPGASSIAVGSATLRVSADGTQATLVYSVSGMTNTHVDHIYSDPYLNIQTTLLYDIAAAHPQADGSYLWKIKPTGSLTNTADILEILAEGKASIVIQTPAYPAGEIGGHFTPANGSQTFTAPPAPPAWTDDHTDTNAAVRFLLQATFGPNPSDVAAVQSLGYAGWISNQLALPATHHLPVVLASKSADPTQPFPSQLTFNTWWQESVTAPDQLRQRVAFALSEIMVVSENGALANYYANGLSSYYDTLLDNSFGNFRTLLKAVTLHPIMGIYLNMQGNDAGSIVSGLHANENFAREIQQLFSIGLNRLWPDGTLVMNSQNALVPTYNQNVVSGFAAVFTGWNYYQTNQANGRLPSNWNPAANYTNPMVLVPTHHDLGPKLLLDNVMLPAAQGAQAISTNASFDTYGSQNLDQALDSIFNNPNVGPFICRELIQRLVTSNPSRNYLYRVVQKFNDNGSGVRGDLSAVIPAILLDYEARSTDLLSQPTFGKQREPLLRVTGVARALPAPPGNGGTYTESGTQTITITTTNAHRLNNGDTVALAFTDTSGNAAPVNGNYSVTSTGTNTFTVSTLNAAAGTYSQNTNTITVNISNHGLLPGNAAYLVFTSGGAASGLFLVITNPTSSTLIVSTPDAAVRSGNCVLPKIAAAGFTQSGTVVTVDCTGPHGLTAGESLFINFPTIVPGDAQYQVATIPDATHFTVNLTTSSNQTQSGFSVYPLNAPALTRSGTVGVANSTWNMGYTDSGSTTSLSQTPLRAPTVFNFFYPGYQFPGALAAAGMTTPEFQLTSDTSVALAMNFLASGVLTNSASNANNANTNGLSSFITGSGAIMLDVGAWMTTNFTASANVPVLVDSLNTRLLAGQLSDAAKWDIVNYVTNVVNFPFSAPPTATQMRDRVHAVVQLILNSPDYTIQK